MSFGSAFRSKCTDMIPYDGRLLLVGAFSLLTLRREFFPVRCFFPNS